MNETPSTTSMLLTPPGAGAIAMVRVVGPEASSIVAQVFRPASSHNSNKPSAGGTLQYGHVFDEEETLDDVLIVESAVRETTAVDITCHGGPRIVERLLDVLQRHGALFDKHPDPTSPWPTSTQIEQETLRAILTAKTPRAVRFLAHQRTVLPAYLHALADTAGTNPDQVREELATITSRYATAQRLVEGCTVMLVGPTNVGKSTLLNRLLGRPASVTSHLEGTTRDWVDAQAEMDGWPVQLVDTAGYREASSDLDRKAWHATIQADFKPACILFVVDGASAEPDADIAQIPEAYRDCPAITVVNKTDVAPAGAVDAIAKHLVDGATPVVAISALDGRGLKNLQDQLLKYLAPSGWSDTLPTLFCVRQHEAAHSLLGKQFDAPSSLGEAIRLDLIGPAP